MHNEGAKTVIGNSIALSLRMAISIAVGLYTSRLIIDAMGLADYGIYSVIGSVIGISSFLNSSLAGATSRYIVVELGRGDAMKLSGIFSTTLKMHLQLAVVVVLLGETVGLWFVNTQMNFPAGSTVAINVLYQLSVLSAFISFTQIPYTSDIIAHERMSIYARYEIFSAVAKLLLVLLIVRLQGDILISYGLLIFGLSVVNAAYFRNYCRKHFEETRRLVKYDKDMARSILRFTGYNLIGNFCTTVKVEGEPILLNLFFGVVSNAAMSISATITGAVGGLATAISQAFRPRIIKQYAADDIPAMQRSMHQAVVFTIGALAMVAIPFVLIPERIFMFWLGQTPPYATTFLRLLLICALLDVVIYINTAALQATGNIRNLSILSGLVSLCCPVLSWLGFKAGYQASCILWINLVGLIAIIFIGWILIDNYIVGFATSRYAAVCTITLLSVALIVAILTMVLIKIKPII